MHLATDDFLTLETEPFAATTPLAPSYKTSRTYLSQVYEAKTPFQLLGLDWQQALPKETEANIEIRFRYGDGTWGDWEAVESNDNDSPDHEEMSIMEGYDQSLWSYVMTETADAFQYRAHLSTQNTALTPKLSDISFDYVSGGKESMAAQVAKLVFDADTDVTSRKEWGADESLRLAKTYNVDDSSDFESELDTDETTVDPDMKIVKRVDEDAKGNPLLWPLEYPNEVKKIIIHHTATTGKITDEESSIRAIYYYHAVTRGWGDIGYNYIIGPSGKVYEGRAGGDGVVAGHAKGFNTASVGVALLGNFENAPLNGPTMKSLEGLIYKKADLWNIEPDGRSKFRGEVMPNILGHRDVGSTACPGEYSYDELNGIREMVGLALDARRHSNTKTDYAYEETLERELITMTPGASATVSVKLKNTGSKTWDNSTFLTVNANSGADSIVTIPKDGKKKTAAMKESSVAPGKTATFSFTVTAKASGGLASFDMVPVFNGSQKTTHYMDLGFYVELPKLDFTVATITAPSSLKPGESKEVVVKLKNTGNLTWNKTGTNAVTLVKSGSSQLSKNTTLASLQEISVAPGKTGTFIFTIKAPTSAGSYTLYFSPNIKDSNAIVSGSGQIALRVMETTEDALILATSTDWDFAAGEKKSLWLQIKNTSGQTWSDSGNKALKFFFTAPKGFTVSTPKLGFKTLSSGTSGKIYFTVTAPKTAGTYELLLQPKIGNTNLLKKAHGIKMTVSGEESFTLNKYVSPIRIKLTPDNEVGTPILTSTSSFAAYDETNLLKVFSANSRVRVSFADEIYTITSGSGKWTANKNVRFQAESETEDEGIMTVATMNQKPAWDTSLNDNSFRGTLEVRAIDENLILINELEMEDYLKGIGEESNSAPMEKIKTILVLARTYATHYTTGNIKFPGFPYDLEDDPNTSQKYLGYGFETRAPNVVKAVEETEGKVVTYNGKVVITPYFSSSDGVATKSAKEVWGWTNTPWLVSVPDTQCEDANGKFAGHGVGLSGCGAEALAEEGKTFEQIIKTYYTGVEISTL